MKLPLMRQIKELPFTAATAASVIMSVHMLPATVFCGEYPRLPGGPDEPEDNPPALQLFSFDVSITSYPFHPSAIHMMINNSS